MDKKVNALRSMPCNRCGAKGRARCLRGCPRGVASSEAPSAYELWKAGRASAIRDEDLSADADPSFALGWRYYFKYEPYEVRPKEGPQATQKTPCGLSDGSGTVRTRYVA